MIQKGGRYRRKGEGGEKKKITHFLQIYRFYFFFFSSSSSSDHYRMGLTGVHAKLQRTVRYDTVVKGKTTRKDYNLIDIFVKLQRMNREGTQIQMLSFIPMLASLLDDNDNDDNNDNNVFRQAISEQLLPAAYNARTRLPISNKAMSLESCSLLLRAIAETIGVSKRSDNNNDAERKLELLRDDSEPLLFIRYLSDFIDDARLTTKSAHWTVYQWSWKCYDHCRRLYRVHCTHRSDDPYFGAIQCVLRTICRIFEDMQILD